LVGRPDRRDDHALPSGSRQQVNSVSTRHIQPDGHGAFNFVCNFAREVRMTTTMVRRRLRQPICSARPVSPG
jgi:hypothetical protein